MRHHPRTQTIAQNNTALYDLEMSRHVAVHLLPELCEPASLAGGIAVVMDVLRATTTIVTALAAGAEAVIPCGEIDEARRIAAGYPAGHALLGGERAGVKISGFDFGNSPAEYTPERVGGRTLVFTTTNGTRALIRAREARRVIVAGFVNLNAVLDVLIEEQGDAHLICAGTDGHVTAEDCLCAGALAAGLRLRALAGSSLDFNDGALLAEALFETQGRDQRKFHDLLRSSRGGRNLIELGMQTDLDDAGCWDRYDIVPELTLQPWQVQAAARSTRTNDGAGRMTSNGRLEAPCTAQ